MVATEVQFQEMFGAVIDETIVMARCACVACNSCTCACSCRRSPKTDIIEWVE